MFSDMSIPSILPDQLAHYVQYVVRNVSNGLSRRNDDGMSKEPSTISERSRTNLGTSETSKVHIPTEEVPVGILGAGKQHRSYLLHFTDSPVGASGLYTALILDSLDIPYKILEARGDVGGRLFTHHFPDPTGAPYNYFDVGAMRFSKIDAMRRLFNLFEYPPLNDGDIQLKEKLILFHHASENAFSSYNGVTFRQNAVPSGDPFRAAQVIQDTDPDPYVLAGAKAIADDVVAPFITRLLDDIKFPGKKDGLEFLMKYDKYSARAYMALAYTPSDSLNIPKEPLPTDVINWCETLTRSTGSYDFAFSEYILQLFRDGWQPGPESSAVQVFCIESVFHIFRVPILTNASDKAVAQTRSRNAWHDIFSGVNPVQFISIRRLHPSDFPTMDLQLTSLPMTWAFTISHMSFAPSPLLSCAQLTLRKPNLHLCSTLPFAHSGMIRASRSVCSSGQPGGQQALIRVEILSILSEDKPTPTSP